MIGTSVQFSSVAQSCPTLCDPMNRSVPGLPVYHQLPEFTQAHVHWVSDAIQPSHPLSSPSPPTLNLSQHQGLFKRVSSLHQVAKVLVLRGSKDGSAIAIVTPFWQVLTESQVKGHLKDFLIRLVGFKGTFSLHFIYTSDIACIASFSIVCISTFPSNCNALKDWFKYFPNVLSVLRTVPEYHTSAWWTSFNEGINELILSQLEKKKCIQYSKYNWTRIFYWLSFAHVLCLSQSNIFLPFCWKVYTMLAFMVFKKLHYTVARWHFYFILITICIGKRLLSTFANDFS